MCNICESWKKDQMTNEEARKAAVEILFSDMTLTNEEELHYIDVVNEAVQKIEEEDKDKSTD